MHTWLRTNSREAIAAARLMNEAGLAVQYPRPFAHDDSAHSSSSWLCVQLMQKLLLDEANLNFDDLVEMERNGTSAAQVAKIQDATFTGRENVGGPGKAGTYQMEGELPTNARGGLLFSCCRPLPEGAKDARGGEETVVRKGGT